MTGSTPPTPFVDARDVTIRFGSKDAVREVSFQVMPNEIVGLVGPNGAGKTTLLRLLAGLLVPSSGSAFIMDTDVVKHPRKARERLGFLPDFAGLYQDMTADEYLRFFADANNLSKTEKERFVEKSLKRADLSDRKDDFIEQLSKGMRAKLSFAAVLAGDPTVLLLDEPLSGLDPLARSALRTNLSSIRKEGRTVIVSSHMLSDLEMLCDRVLFMDEGKLVTPRSEGDSGRAHYLLKARTGEDEVTRVLSEIEGIGSFEHEPGLGRFVLDLATANDGPAVLARIVSAGLEVISWSPAGGDLEERFMSAVKGDRE